MKFTMVHNNINVSNMEKSLEFYKKALGLTVSRSHKEPDGSFVINFLKDEESDWELELTCLTDHPEKYDLGDNEIHLAFVAEDFDAAYKFHKEMGCICYENVGMGIYFIEDPDGYWMEIVPHRNA